MNLDELLRAVVAAGLRLANAGGRLQLRGPTGAVTAEIRAGVAEQKDLILAMLPARTASTDADFAVTAPTTVAAPSSPDQDERGGGAVRPPGDRPAAPTDRASVTIGDKEYPYRRRWRGERLLPRDGFLAFDTETDVVDLKREIPRLALASASAGRKDSCLVHPEAVGKFVLAHKNLHWVGHNTAFDFWVVARHLRENGEETALRAWWQVAEANRLHDAMLLDMLVRLARDDSFPDPRDLSVVAKEYADLEISKDDPYRMRYGEIIGADWAAVEQGFFDYAAKDAVVTRAAYRAMRKQALALAEEFGRHDPDVLPDAAERFGLLTETIQTKKAIALAQIQRNGMCLDAPRLAAAEADLRKRLDGLVAAVRELCPALYKLRKDGALIATKSGSPSKSKVALEAKLQEVTEELRRGGVQVRIPQTKKTRKPSASTEAWAEYTDHHPFLRAWVEAEESAKLLQFFGRLRGDRVHPNYKVMKRGGRTAAANPNVQQIPRDGPLRQAFVASPGHLLLTVDYKFIELVALAAVCLHRYGGSSLADVIKAGTDPHAHTAALMLDVPPDEFLGWKHDPARAGRYAAARQGAKVINFGVPAGLGADSLANYAKKNYQVELTTEEARQRRELLVGEIYPELGEYVAEDCAAVLARNLRAPAEAVREALGDVHLTSVRKILEGDPKRTDGRPYDAEFVRRVWAALAVVNRNPFLRDALGERHPSADLAAKVCQAGVATLTGRIRGRVRYSQARNTPFQGLAADGAGLALFALVKEGIRVVAFVHDEVLVELPDEGGYVSEARVRRVEEVMCREMGRVLVGGLPVSCESALARRWDKKAKLIVEDGFVYPWEPDGEGKAGSAPSTAPSR
jgi:DNA polymerase I-like protein with 3'-5' exonuclease and polymerase domains